MHCISRMENSGEVVVGGSSMFVKGVRIQICKCRIFSGDGIRERLSGNIWGVHGGE